MQILEYPGNYLPSRILAELRAAGSDVAGVTSTENDDGTVAAIQVIASDSVDENTVAQVVEQVGEGPDPAVALAQVRATRDDLLKQSDWTILPDSPLDDTARAAWTTYRQQLRDLPEKKKFDPFNPSWPDQPAA